MVPPNTPFYPASYQVNGNHTFAVGLQSANVIATALASTTDPRKAQKAIETSLGKWAQEIETIGKRAAQESGWQYTGIDLSPAPLKDISIGGAIENFTHQPLGSNGTLAVIAIITRALKNIRVTRTGYSGVMLPVLEDSVIARRWSEGRLSLNSLLLDSSVCATGLDIIPMPGDTTEAQIEPILGDVASLAYKWHKPLAARLLPVKGKKAGETDENFKIHFCITCENPADPMNDSREYTGGTMESKLSLEFLRVVEQAAIASAHTMGLGDRHKADAVAVEAMRREMDTVGMDGTIVIGEGERDKAPMLYIGEKVGRQRSTKTAIRPSTLPSIRSKALICAPRANPTPSPFSRRAREAACSTRPTCTWKKLSSAHPAKARWISTRPCQRQSPCHRAAARTPHRRLGHHRA